MSTPLPTQTEDVPTINGIPLRLSFAPDAIREHFEIDENQALVDAAATLDDATLARVGLDALFDDRLYEVFHTVLAEALRDII